MDTFLITGGAGFIGSHLTEKLLEQGNKVIVLDNFNDYYNPQIKNKNIEEITSSLHCLELDENSLKVIEGDIRDGKILEEAFAGDEINCVIHLAACAGVRPSIEAPAQYYDVNIMGTLNVLETMKRHKCKNLIFASSSSVYGNSHNVPFSEEDKADNPISPYAASKKSGELLCYTYSSLYALKTACLRFFTVYGPRQRPDLAISKFTQMILDNQKIPFYGNGDTKRDYTYVDDIIQGILLAIGWINRESSQYEIFNLGESRTVSLTEMVQTIENALGKVAQLDYMPLQQGDVEETYADIRKASEILGYAPGTEFALGIEKFIKWYKQRDEI